MWSEDEIESVNMSQAELQSHRDMFKAMALVDLRQAGIEDCWRLQAERDWLKEQGR